MSLHFALISAVLPYSFYRFLIATYLPLTLSFVTIPVLQCGAPQCRTWSSSPQVMDRETRDRYVLTVVATDNGTPESKASTTVTITVLDANDNTPTFSQQVRLHFLYIFSCLFDLRN